LSGQPSSIKASSCEQPAVMRTARLELADSQARMIRIALTEEGRMRVLDVVLEFSMSCHSGGTRTILIDPVLQVARVILIGESPVGAAVAVLAPRVGLPLTLRALAVWR
jgi:xanthine dehydrogenase accessory factor